MTVTLRKRKISDTKWTWTLDIHDGDLRRRESTGLFFDLTKTRVENHEAELLAQAMRGQRYEEIKKELRSPSDPRLHQSFSDYFLDVADRDWRHGGRGSRKVSDSTQRQWRGAAAWVKAWEAETDISPTLADIDSQWLERFKKFLLTSGLKQSSAALIWSKLESCLHEAVHELIIERNPCADVRGISMPSRFDTEFLEDYELAELMKTPIPRYPDVARAFLWSCLTGQRPSDVRRLKHNQIRKIGGGYVIVFTQKKTGDKTKELHVPISQDAVDIIGTLSNDDTPIFALPSHKYVNEAIEEWCRDAGITRKVTYKTSRHTYCTRMLRHTGNLVVVAAGAGHKDFKSAMRYVHVVNKDLQDAVDTMPRIGIPASLRGSK